MTCRRGLAYFLPGSLWFCSVPWSPALCKSCLGKATVITSPPGERGQVQSCMPRAPAQCLAPRLKNPVSEDAVFTKQGCDDEPRQTFHFCRINCADVSPLPESHLTSTWLKISSVPLADCWWYSRATVSAGEKDRRWSENQSACSLARGWDVDARGSSLPLPWTLLAVSCLF